MELIRPDINFPFMRYRFIWIWTSLGLAILSVYLWVHTGSKKYGVDFLGGTEVIVKFDQEMKIGTLRELTEKGGFAGIVVQSFENEPNTFSVRLPSDQSGETPKKIRNIFQSVAGNHANILKEDYVGPVIGDQIRKDGLMALGFSVIAILVYVAVRFDFSFGLGAIIALLHDVVITAGMYLLAGREVNAAFLAAELTILGYSVNDTIIVYDRIRENLALAEKKGVKHRSKEEWFKHMSEIIDHSINQTLSRTILTSLMTLFVVTTLWLFGGGAVADLNFTLMVGIIYGTYSSIFIASPVVLSWARFRAKN